MVFLRPIIVRAPEDSFGFTADRYEHIRALEINTSKNEKEPELLQKFEPKPPSLGSEWEDKDDSSGFDDDGPLGPPDGTDDLSQDGDERAP